MIEIVRRRENADLIYIPCHTNLLAFTEVYHYNTFTYLVSELLFFTLNDIYCTPLGPFPQLEIAQVARDILSALQFLHTKLNCSHS